MRKCLCKTICGLVLCKSLIFGFLLVFNEHLLRQKASPYICRPSFSSLQLLIEYCAITRKFNLYKALAAMSMLWVCPVWSDTIAYYRFETEGGVLVDDLETYPPFSTVASSVIDDETGNYPASVHMPTDGGLPLRYGYATINGVALDDPNFVDCVVPQTQEITKWALGSTSQNYGNTDRWVQFEDGALDGIGSFTVECWISLADVWNYLYDEQQVWHFGVLNALEETVEGFELRIKEEYGGGPVGSVQFVHTLSSGAVIVASAPWTVGTTSDDWVNIATAYNMEAGTMSIYVDGQLVETVVDTSGQGLGFGNETWVYHIMGGRSDHGKRFYGRVDEFRISNEALKTHKLLANKYPATCQELWSYDVGYDADLNKDCFVDNKDLEIMAGNWLDCNNFADSFCY